MGRRSKPPPRRTAAKIRRMLEAGAGDGKIARALNVTRHAVRKIAAERAAELAAQAARRRPDMTLPLDCIHIGDRIRKDYGDIASLARSIDANGLLHPVVVRVRGPHPDRSVAMGGGYELVAGERRMRAWRQSRRCNEPIPVRVVDLASIRRGEFAENHERKNFTPSELVEIKRQLEIEFDLKGAAAQRRRAGKKAAPGEAGRALDTVAAYAGRSGRTIEKAELVVAAAERDPERFGPIQEQMDRSGKVDGPARRVRNMLAADAIKAEPPPLPMQGPYRTIVIDPPWPADLDGGRAVEGRGYYPYATMTIEEIAALDVASIAHPDGCALWLWITNFHLVRGCQLPLLKAWGFNASTLLTWCKPQFGHGQRLRGATEHAILAVRGEVPCLAGEQRTWFADERGRKREHSGKPGEFFDIVREVTPAPRYAYLFAGRTLPADWDGHGDRFGAPAQAEAAE
jgi:N6-adenosine-specific RNA methylase IME4